MLIVVLLRYVLSHIIKNLTHFQILVTLLTSL